MPEPVLVLQRSLSHNNSVYWAAFSRDGKRLATASLDNTAKLWNVADGGLAATLKATAVTSTHLLAVRIVAPFLWKWIRTPDHSTRGRGVSVRNALRLEPRRRADVSRRAKQNRLAGGNPRAGREFRRDG